jgi:hypothetical protein
MPGNYDKGTSGACFCFVTLCSSPVTGKATRSAPLAQRDADIGAGPIIGSGMARYCQLSPRYVGGGQSFSEAGATCTSSSTHRQSVLPSATKSSWARLCNHRLRSSLSAPRCQCSLHSHVLRTLCSLPCPLARRHVGGAAGPLP